MYSLADDYREQAPRPLAFFDEDYIAPENQKLMAEYLTLFRQLDGHELNRLTKEREKLRRQLIKGRYNPLCLAQDNALIQLDTIMQRYTELKRQATDLRAVIEASRKRPAELPRSYTLRRWAWKPTTPGARTKPRSLEIIGKPAGDRKAMAEMRRVVQELRLTAKTGQALQKRLAAIRRRLAELKPTYERYAAVNYQLDNHDQAVTLWKTEKAERKLMKREARYIESLLLDVFRNTAECHRVWTDARGTEHITIPKFEEVGTDSDSHWFRLATSKKTFWGWKSVLPYRVNVEALIAERTLQNMSVAVRRQVEVRTNPSKTVIFFRVNRLDSPDGLPRLVTYRQMIKHYPSDDHDNVPFPGGVKAGRRNYWLNFSAQPHMLVAGFTKSGKSNFINCIVATAVTMHSPDEVRIALIDNKGGVEFSHWSAVPHLWGAVVERVDDVLPKLAQVIAVMSHRYQLLKAVRAKDIETFNKEQPGRRMPRLILFVDEMATLMHRGPLTADIHQALTEIASLGRAAGVHLVLCTQHPSKEIVPMPIKTNLAVRVSGRMPTGAASMTVLDTHMAKEIEAVPGRMIIQEGPDPEIVQTPYISYDDIRQAVIAANRYPPGNDAHESLIVDGPVVHLSFGERDVLEIVMEFLGGALKASKVWEMVKEERKTSNRDVQRLVKGLQDQKTIEYQGVTYKPVKKPGNFYQLVEVKKTDEDTAEVPAVAPLTAAAD